jgi:hypothetical protein
LKSLRASGRKTNSAPHVGAVKLVNEVEAQYTEKCRKGPAAGIPTPDVHLHETGHIHSFDSKKRICKKPGFKGTPEVVCMKCKVHFRFTPTLNCVVEFHCNQQRLQ